MEKSPFTGNKVGPDKVMCRFKWDYPIVNLMSGHIRNCCRTPKQVITEAQLQQYGKDAIMNLPYERERRLEKLQGITHQDCQSCLQLEATGVPAPRTGTKGFIEDYWARRDPETVKSKWPDKFQTFRTDAMTINSPEVYSQHVSMLEIVLGNICDLKCTYCSAHYSNQWAKELIEFGEMSKESYQEVFPEAPPSLEKVFWEWFYDVARYSVKRINFLGGEPTYIPKFYTILEKLRVAYEDLEKGKVDWPVELGVITNLNCTEQTLNKFISHLDPLSKHFALRIEPSMEALGVRAEYIRQNLSWDRFERNIRTLLSFVKEKQYTSDQFILSFQMALNTFSISSLPGFLRWTQSLIEEYQIPIGLAQNVVSFPRHHNPLILTPDFAYYIEDAIEILKKHEEANDRYLKNSHWASAWSNFRTKHLEGIYESILNEQRSEFLMESREQFFDFVNKIKSRRGKDFETLFPEYRHFYQICGGSKINNRNNPELELS
jgi:organic radical activating enzyme